MEIADLHAALGLKPNNAQWKLGNDLINGIKTGLAALALYQGAEWFKSLITDTTEAAVGADRLSQKLGISTDSIQELGYAAKVSGSSAEELQHGMQKVALGLEQAKKNGTGPLVEGLRTLKIPMSQIKGLSLDKVMLRIADGFADAGPQVNKTGVAMQIMGRSGTTLIPFLNRGADGINELRREAEELGAVIGKDTITSFKELKENEERLSAGLTGLRNTFVAALLPALNAATASALAWFRANRTEIIEKLTMLVHGLEAAFRFLRTTLGYVIEFSKAVWAALSDLIEKNESLRKVLEGVAIAAGILAVVLLAPWLAIGAAIGVVILIVQDLLSWFSGGPSIIQYFGEVAVATFDDIAKLMAKKFDEVTTRIDDWFMNEAPGAIMIWYASIKGLTEFAVSQFKVLLEYLDKITDAISFISKVPGMSLAGDFFNGNLRDEASAGADTIKSGAVNAGVSAGFVGTGFEGASQDGAGVAMMRRLLGQTVTTDGGALSTTSSHTFEANITVHAGEGADGDAIGKSVIQQIREHWDGKMRELAATTEQP